MPYDAQRLGERRASTVLIDGTALTARPFDLKLDFDMLLTLAAPGAWQGSPSIVPRYMAFQSS